jgi:CheY-like chemotaxis protein
VEDCRLQFIALMADDDEDDCLLVKSAFEITGTAREAHIVGDGGKLMEYLNREGEYSDPAKSPRPDLILLDLNMPCKDGRESLKEIKSDPRFKDIPVVVLTTSGEERDIAFCRAAGASAFITKPVMFEDWVKMVRSLTAFLLGDSSLSGKVKAREPYSSGETGSGR